MNRPKIRLFTGVEIPPNRVICSIRVYKRYRNSRQIDCQKVLLQEEARFLTKQHKTAGIQL
jgi:hypothetical protein